MPAEWHEQAFSVLDSTLPVIRLTLTSFYGFDTNEAEAFEDVLCIWFHRMSRRLGGHTASVSEMREQLLFVACKYARALQLAKLKANERPEQRLALALARSPEEVAWEISTRLENRP